MLESKTSSKSKDSKDDTSVSAQSTEQSGASHSSHSDTSLTTVLHKIEPDKNNDKVSIGDVMSALSEKGFGPLLFAPALIAIMPTGGIPGVPTVCGVIIALISIQMLFGKQRPWLPKFIDKVSFEQDKLHKGVAIAEKATKRIDKIVKPRLTVLSSDKAKKTSSSSMCFCCPSYDPIRGCTLCCYDTRCRYHIVCYWTNHRRWLRLFGSFTFEYSDRLLFGDSGTYGIKGFVKQTGKYVKCISATDCLYYHVD